jgi:hypothetical protein
MKIILAVLGLVVFAGCQDLGDYPDYKTPASKTDGPGSSVSGAPVYSGPTEWSFVLGGYIQGVGIPIPIDATKVHTEGSLPSGLTVLWSRGHVPGEPERKYVCSWMGTPNVAGVFEFFLVITNANGQTRVKFVVTIRESQVVRQAVSQ